MAGLNPHAGEARLFGDEDADEGDDDYEVFVKFPDDKTITLNVEASYSIAIVKGLIKNKADIPKHQQRLIFNEQQKATTNIATRCSLRSLR